MTDREALVAAKRKAELRFWRDWIGQHGCRARTDYYRSFMTTMGDIRDLSFFRGKICVDIGCGPMGSLTWLPDPRAAIGIDPLAEEYREFGIENHEMVYLRLGAESLPFPSASVDVVFSMNSLSYVDDLAKACFEIRRVLKPGGHFIGSLNLDTTTTTVQPWVLTEKLLGRVLFPGWLPEHHVVRPRTSEPGDPYRSFFDPAPPKARPEDEKILWCRYRVAQRPRNHDR